MKPKIILFAIAITLVINSNAQLKVFSTGNTGIDAANPVSRFTVGGNGFSDCKVTFHNNITTNNSKTLRLDTPLPAAGATYAYGLFSTFQAGTTDNVPIAIFASVYRGSTPQNGQGVGIRIQSGNATSGYNYSLLAELMGSNYGAAICATTPGKSVVPMPGIFAGYFRGNVYIENDLDVDGVFTQSDINLKKNVVRLEENNINKIMQVSAIKYNLKNPLEIGILSKEVVDTGKVSYTETELNDPKYSRDHIGISAQELQKVYPELVKVNDQGFLSVNYIELIPILMEAIKEQQVTIEELRKKMENLSSKKPNN